MAPSISAEAAAPVGGAPGSGAAEAGAAGSATAPTGSSAAAASMASLRFMGALLGVGSRYGGTLTAVQ